MALAMDATGDAATQRTIADRSDAPLADVAEAPIGPELGRYLVIDEIGAGGMGRVFRAYDPKLGREVALKRLRLRTRSGTTDGARMLREAKAMAQLAHPNVVSIFDVDIDGGSLFIAMEYVKGVTLSAWLREAPRTWPEILDMYVRAGRGLAAAHAQGIVHRDFKPSNVVVGEDARPRVMDFGLARASGASTSGDFDVLPEALGHGPELAAFDSHGAAADLGATLTALGTVVGTPPFMAPEQHLGEAVDARTDQYAFCVALWGALAGRAPFVGADASSLAAAKLAGPPKPPTGTAAPARVYAALVRGMAVDPDGRWVDMRALLEELERVTAPSSRSRVAATLAASIVAVGVGAWWLGREGPCRDSAAEIESTWGADARARVDRALRDTKASFAESTALRVAAAFDRHAEAWSAMHRDACEATKVRREQSDEALDLRMKCLAARKAELGDAVALLTTADVAVTQKAVELATGLTPIDRCADVAVLRERAPPPDQPELRDAIEAARAGYDHARLLARVGRLETALATAEVSRSAAAITGYAPVIAEGEVSVGSILIALDRKAEAQPLLEHALDTALAHRRNHTAATAAVELTSMLVGHSGRAQQTRWLARTALGLAEGDGSDPRLIADAMLVYGNVFTDLELELEALPYFQGSVTRLEAAVGPSHPDLIGPLVSNAKLLHVLNRDAEADAASRRALAIAESAYGPDHPAVADALAQLGWNALTDGRHAEALVHFDRAYVINETAFGPEHRAVWAALAMRATALAEQEHYDEAAAALEESLRRMTRALPEAHPSRASTYHNLATVYSRQGDHAKAADAARESVRLRRLLGHNATLAAGLTSLGSELTELGRYEDAEQTLTEAAKVAAAAHADDGGYTPSPEVRLADVIRRRGDLPRARDLLESIVKRASPETHATQLAEAEFLLGQVLWELDDGRARAVALVEGAVARIRARTEDPDELEAMQSWLDGHVITAAENTIVPAPP
jgi:tetratricopeptide (TPR) repeat protein